MTEQEIKKSVHRFRKEHNLQIINFDVLCTTAENLGYTVIEFDRALSDVNVRHLMHALGLEVYAPYAKAFTYSDGHYRLIFVNEALNQQEKTIVMAHKLGHITCNHFNTVVTIVGRDVQEEYEANAFAHYLLQKKRKPLTRKAKVLLSVILAVILLAGAGTGIALAVQKAKHPPVPTYYITQSGIKYHRDDCRFIKGKTNVTPITEEEALARGYTPCGICLPGEHTD